MAPQAGSWLNYRIPAKSYTKLGSPFIGGLRAARLLLQASNISNKKTWAQYAKTPIDLAPDGYYLANSVDKFEIEFSPTATIPRTQIATHPVIATAQCNTWAKTKVTFDASTAYEWDVGSAPDIAFVMSTGTISKVSTVNK